MPSGTPSRDSGVASPLTGSVRVAETRSPVIVQDMVWKAVRTNEDVRHRAQVHVFLGVGRAEAYIDDGNRDHASAWGLTLDGLLPLRLEHVHGCGSFQASSWRRIRLALLGSCMFCCGEQVAVQLGEHR